jgi:Leucine-rich repeat (LRR) protein
MFDGVIRILCDVRHILDLRKNLILLSILDYNFNFKSEDGVMKMCKGDMIVMKGQRLLGNTKVLDISNNYLSGMLPMWIGNATDLRAIDLSKNHF